MEELNVNHSATRKPTRTLHGPIDPDKVIFKPAPKWAYEYLSQRDNDIFAALARADAEDD